MQEQGRSQGVWGVGAWGGVAHPTDYPAPSLKMSVKIDFNDKKYSL